MKKKYKIPLNLPLTERETLKSKLVFWGVVIVIILLGFFLRTYSLDKSPASVNFDEAALGYNAYSILKTGKDEYGNFLPLSLRSFNDYKPALYSYFSIPFIYLMGLNETSTRMVSAVAGTFSLIFLFLFLKEFIKNKKILLFLFLFISISPWRLHFSRTAFESNLSLAFFAAGAWFLYKLRIKSREDFKFYKILLPLIFFVFSAYSYHSARLAVPILFVLWALDVLLMVFKNKISINFYRFIPLIIFILLIIPVFMLDKGLVLTRFKQENIFNRYFPYSPKELVNKENPWLDLNSNPVYYFGALITGHVISYISPINLSQRVFHWVKNSPQYISGLGMYDWMSGLVFVIGIIYLFKDLKNNFKNRFIVYWIIAAAAPAAVTWNWFHPLRSLNLFPALDVVVALGFYRLFVFLKSKILLGIFGFLLLVTSIFVINNEFNFNVWENHGEYQPGGFKKGMPILKSIQDKYDKVLIDSPHAQSYIFFLFYQSFPPEIVQKYSEARPKPGVDGNLNFNFYKYEFGKFNWPSQKNNHKEIFWATGEVKENEIYETPGANLIYIPNAVDPKAIKLITKE